jgi:translation initiation factor eIF-2B subunit alpha
MSAPDEKSAVGAAYAQFLADEQYEGSASAAGIKALTEYIKLSSATTMMGLRDELRRAGEELSQRQDAPMSISSLCELFVRFVTRTALEAKDFDACKRMLIDRGEMFARTTLEARGKIAKVAVPFIDAGGIVLTTGYSRVVISLLQLAARTKHFTVIVAESHPQGGGHTTAAVLSQDGVPVTMIEDAAVAYAMSRCQMVLVGAEAVLESGGIINKTGTYQIAIVAAACKKPFYVASESTKFARMFPLSQSDLPEHEMQREHAAYIGRGTPPPMLKLEKPSRDYTPPSYITMLFTDLGVLTPSAVSDELIKLFD